jgi:hypothetical protein
LLLSYKQGTYEGELQASAKQLQATTAAAVAAAARALSSTAEPWDSMQMELEVTHTVQSKGCTWGHASLLGKQSSILVTCSAAVIYMYCMYCCVLAVL